MAGALLTTGFPRAWPAPGHLASQPLLNTPTAHAQAGQTGCLEQGQEPAADLELGWVEARKEVCLPLPFFPSMPPFLVLCERHTGANRRPSSRLERDKRERASTEALCLPLSLAPGEPAQACHHPFPFRSEPRSLTCKAGVILCCPLVPVLRT